MPYLDMLQGYQITLLHTRPCYIKSSYRSTYPDPTWKRQPGRPRAMSTDQLCRDNNNVPIATLWRQTIGQGHLRATLWSMLTTHHINNDDVVVRMFDLRSRGQEVTGLTLNLLSRNSSCQAVYIRASVTKQYNLLWAKGQ